MEQPYIGRKCSLELFIASEEKSVSGFRASKSWMTVLLGANAADNFKLKTIRIYHSKNLLSACVLCMEQQSLDDSTSVNMVYWIF